MLSSRRKTEVNNSQVEVELRMNRRSETFVLQSLSKAFRIRQLYTLVGGVYLSVKQVELPEMLSIFKLTQADTADDFSADDILDIRSSVFSDEDFVEQKTFTLTTDEAMKTLPDQTLKYDLIPMTVAVYAPKVFNYFRQKDYPMVDLESSFSLIQVSDTPKYLRMNCQSVTKEVLTEEKAVRSSTLHMIGRCY